MAEKTPVRVVFNASNVATGLAEFQSGDAVGVDFGGTGLNALGLAGQVLKVNAAGTALEFGAEGDISITNLVAPTNSDLTLTTSGTGNIVLDAITIRGTTITSADSSIININEGVIVDGTLNTSGQATLSGLAYPTSDGTVGQFLQTDGSGTLAFADLSLGDLTIIGSTISVPSNADFILDPSGTGAIKLNANTDITGNLTVTGTLDLGDSNFTNVGSLQLDSIAGDGDTNTSITFSGSDVITVATGGSTAATFNADQSSTFNSTVTATSFVTTGNAVTIADNNITTGTSNADINITPHGTGSVVISQISTDSVTGEVIPGKFGGTNFARSMIIGHSTTGTLNDAVNNTGVGEASLEDITTGDDNTAVGRRSLKDLNVGGANTALGAEALKTITGNSGNTGIGRSALALTTGTNNIGLGLGAGDNITSGSGNVIIGNVDADSATGDRQLKIVGYDGTTTTTWISGDSSGKVSFPGGDGSGIGILSSTISTAASNADINITPHGTGGVVITSGGVAFTLPTSDGASGDTLITDGAGTLSFSSSTPSDDTRAVVKNNKAVSTTARTVDYFQSSAADVAWYFVALSDLTNDHSSASCFAVVHNDSDAFIGGPRGGASGSDNSLPSTTADISSNQVRVKIAAPSNDSKISYYKIPISRANTADATAGVTVTTSNTDVDSASESIDTFAHASFRAAKYLIVIDDNAKTETGVTEALVVHDGTNAFVTQHGTVQTGNNDMITLSAAISGSNVVLSAAGLTPNLSLKIHKTLLSDSMTAVSNNNQKIIGATTVSSTATAFDSFDLDDVTAAMYYVVGKNATEGAFSVQEVYCSGAPGEASVSHGPFVSTKGTVQLEFEAAFDADEDNTLQMSVSSTSGGSTVVNAYRINCLAE